MLRLIERRNPVVGSVTTLRIQQGVEYSQISHDKDIPGWEIVLKDQKKTLTSDLEKKKQFLEDLLQNGHVPDYPAGNIFDEPPTFRERMTKFMRDRLLIDKVCLEIERNQKGEAVALWTLDGATILPVLPGGYYGSTSAISAGIFTGFSKLSDEIKKYKMDAIPPVEEIAYVQELLYGMTGGGVCAAFRRSDLIYDISNDLNDIRYYKQGFSKTEKANTAVTAFINSLMYNSNGLSRGSIPKVALAMGKESGYTTAQLEDMQDEWMANFEGVDGQWNIPLLNGDAKVLNLFPNNRDMEYQKYMEFCGALICAEMGADPAEAGLRFNQAQNVLSENQDAKQVFSKNRGLTELLGEYADIMNKFIRLSGYKFADLFVFKFNGISTEDKGFEADLIKKKLETFMTVNEVRKEQGLEPVENGDVILNSIFFQNKQAAAMAGGGIGGEDDGGDMMGSDDDADSNGLNDEDVDAAVDEALNDIDMGKAIRLI